MWQWIEENISQDPDRLRLKYHGADGPFDYAGAILQIECRQRFGKKLAHTLERNPQFVFPSSLSGEQSTSDILASWHAGLVPAGSRVVDLTAGLGIDAMHLAEKAASVTAIERTPETAEALRINSQYLDNINVIQGDCIEFLANYAGEPFDIAFIDPARRGTRGERLFALSDCEPDVTTLLPSISRVARRLIVKASPMLDPAQTIALLPGCRHLYILGTPTECKEIVADVPFHTSASPTTCQITAVTIRPDGSQSAVTFTRESEAAITPRFETPSVGQYILEPSPTLMKAACHHTLAALYNGAEISPNTHVLTCATPPSDFPGTVSEILEIIPYRSREIKQLARRWQRLEIATRNFGITPDALRRQLHVAPGGPLRLLALTAAPSTRLLLILRPL